MTKLETFPCAGCGTVVSFIDNVASQKCMCFCDCKEVSTGIIDESTQIVEVITEACDLCIERQLYPSIEPMESKE